MFSGRRKNLVTPDRLPPSPVSPGQPDARRCNNKRVPLSTVLPSCPSPACLPNPYFALLPTVTDEVIADVTPMHIAAGTNDATSLRACLRFCHPNIVDKEGTRGIIRNPSDLKDARR